MTLAFGPIGEAQAGFAEPVLNERAVRASAGILFALALVGFMRAWLLGDFGFVRVFALAFLIDFSLRLFVTPLASPSLVLGQWFVRGQQPEWVSAQPKRFAWALGYVLALVTVYLVVYQGVVGPLNLLVCVLCLTLLFFESAFGICLGCKVYAWLNRSAPEQCAGDACVYQPQAGAAGRARQWAVVGVFVASLFWWVPKVPSDHDLAHAVTSTAAPAPMEPAAPAAQGEPTDAAVSPEAQRCVVPDFAKAMGHEALWKKHNHCE